ncbi:hypothetical protein Gotur_008064 [Gossypium turneri]
MLVTLLIVTLIQSWSF